MKKSLFSLTICLFSVLFILFGFNFINGQFFLIRGDDYPFHFSRIYSTIEQLNVGKIYTPITLFGSQQLLYGVNLFYPIFTTILPISFLANLFHSVIPSIYIYLFLINILTFLIAFYSCQYILKKTFSAKEQTFYFWTSYIFSFLYLFSHYRVLCFYTRIDFGEFFSLSMYPLIFAGFYSVLKDNGRHKNWLIIGITLVAYSHILSLFLILFLLMLFFLIQLILKKISLTIVKQFFISGLFTLGLSAPVLLPLAYEMLTLGIRSVSKHNLFQEAYGPFTIFIGSVTNHLSYMSMGIVLLVTQLIALWLFIKKPQSLIRTNRLLTTCFIMCLFFSLSLSKLFPWFIFQKTPLTIIQFPFRLMAFLTVFGNFLASILLVHWRITSKKSLTKLTLFLSTLVIVLNFSSVYGLIIERDSSHLFYDENSIVSSKRYQQSINKDYFPSNITKKQSKDITKKIGYINDSPVSMDYNNENLTFNLNLLDEQNDITTPIIAYSGLELMTQNGEKINTDHSSAKTLAFTLPKGKYTISVQYKTTIIQKISIGIGIISLVSLFIITQKKKT